MDKTYEIGGKKFVLDENKAVQAYQEKKVINGRESMTFNLLPLKYQWAYDLYRKMKSNHWEPRIFQCRKTWSSGKTQPNFPIVSGGLSWWELDISLLRKGLWEITSSMLFVNLLLHPNSNWFSDGTPMKKIFMLTVCCTWSVPWGLILMSVKPCLNKLIPVGKMSLWREFQRICGVTLILPRPRISITREKYLYFWPMHGRNSVLRAFRDGS